MRLTLLTTSYLVDSQHVPLFMIEGNMFDYTCQLESATAEFFKNNIFFSENQIVINKKLKNVTLVFYPGRNKTYVVAKELFEQFIEKYFPNAEVIARQPEFYSFLIPFPDIEFFKENSEITEQDKFNITITKFRKRTYMNIESFTVRLKTPHNYDFRESQFDPIFQKDFQNIIDLSGKYKEYLSSFLNLEPYKIDTRNLILPYYEITLEEIKGIIALRDSILDGIHGAMLEESERVEDEKYNKAFDRQVDELYWEAFENNPENLLNIE